LAHNIQHFRLPSCLKKKQHTSQTLRTTPLVKCRSCELNPSLTSLGRGRPVASTSTTCQLSTNHTPQKPCSTTPPTQRTAHPRLHLLGQWPSCLIHIQQPLINTQHRTLHRRPRLAAAAMLLLFAAALSLFSLAARCSRLPAMLPIRKCPKRCAGPRAGA
jgi:hypothetical protein